MWATPKTSSAQRGYSNKHRKLRAQLLPYAYGQPCTRCGRIMLPGQALHLDHTDDRAGYRGFSHAKCNIRAGAIAGARKANRRRKLRKIITADRW
jgi:hypothetical protein